MTKKADTVIIGGGVGGTALGALLASGGQHVVLLDKNNIIGGRCTSYEKEGFIVDVGVHLFGLGEKGPLSDVCRKAGDPNGIEWVLAKNPRVGMYYKGKLQGFTKDSMAKTTGAVKKSKPSGKAAQLHSDIMEMSDEEINSLWYESLLNFVIRYTSDPDTLAMYALLCGVYFCTTPDVTSAAEFILAFRDINLKKSSAYPKGGCISIPKAYQKIIEKNGGEVLLKRPVDEIIIENGTAIGVKAGGETILADRVISNADIKTTIGTLAAAKHFPEEYYKRIQELTYTSHVVSLKVALNKKITDQKMVMYMPDLNDEETIKLAMAYIRGTEMPMVPAGMFNVPTNFDPSLAPEENQQMIFFGSKCDRHQDWKKWGEVCMSGLKAIFPDIEDHILWKRVDSPDLVNNYAGEDGNIIGVGQTVNQIHERRPKQETPVKNLFLCSAEAGGHGIGTELAATSALELADVILKK